MKPAFRSLFVALLRDRGYLGTVGFRGIMLTAFVAILWILPCHSAGGAENPGSGLDLVFVIDNSGSMRKNDPDFLTPQIVRTFISQLPTDTHAGMVIFDTKAQMPEPLGSLAEASARDRLFKSLDRIDYRGRYTNSPAGIERAIYELKSRGRAQALKCIIFLTDGLVDTGTPEKDNELTQWLKDDLTAESQSLGIRIFGIAFTENADFALIQTLSARTQGSYYRAYQASDLADVLDHIQKHLLTSAALPSSAVSTAEPPAREAPPPATEKLQSSGEPVVTTEPSAPAGSRTISFGWLTLSAIILGLVLYAGWRGFGRRGWGKKAAPIAEPQTSAQTSAENKGAGGLPQVPFWQLEDLTLPGAPATGFNVLRISVGRDAKNNLVIAKPTISNLHATIEFHDGSFFLEDQRSTNGTRLNDRRVAPNQPVRLKSGDRIKFASHEFRFVRLDQLLSGDTIMLSVAPAHSPAEFSPPGDTFRLTDGEMNLRFALERHLAQISELGAKYATFVAQYFNEEIVRMLAVQAHENMEQTIVDGDQHCSPLIKGRAFYVVCSLPVPLQGACAWFNSRHGGFTDFIYQWIKSKAYDVTACDTFCVLTFGLDQGAWVSMTVVPTHAESDPVEIMSVDFLTEAEKAKLALDFDDKGRVV